MRINRYVALATGMSRRLADTAIKAGRVRLNRKTAVLGDKVDPGDEITLDQNKLKLKGNFTTIMLNKPAGYVCSRNGQGSKTIYRLLPEKYHRLKPVGRLDKDSSGLLLLTDDGKLADKLAHPRHQKEKVYKATLNKRVAQDDKNRLLTGVKLDDGMSKFIKLKQCSSNTYEITLGEGRNRQVRRTFSALGYSVKSLHRLKFGDFTLGKSLAKGSYSYLPESD